MLDIAAAQASAQQERDTSASARLIRVQTSRKSPGGLRRTHWKQDEPISSWLYSLGVARFIVRQGGIYHEILEEAAAMKADLIVMTSHRPAMRTYFLGSNAGHVVRYATCSVLVVRR